MSDKAIVQQYAEMLIQMTNEFCDLHLDQEYKALCEKMIRKMARKRVVPFLTGKKEIWAAAIIHAIGRANFLFDKSFQPYTTVGEICEFFGTSKSTTTQKAKLISDMFKIRYYDPEFSTMKMRESNPFAAFFNGMPISLGALPPELQEVAREHPEKPLVLWTFENNEEQ